MNKTVPSVWKVIGADNFGENLRHAANGKTVDGRSFVIKRLSKKDDFRCCQILFIRDSKSSHVADILSKVGSLPILTVDEDKAFSKAGGIINFVLKNGNVRLAINLTAANQAGLKISSKLLAVADTVKGKAERP